MLKQLGRLERTRNIVILLFAILMAVSLVIFYAPGRSSGNIDPAKNTEVVAKVGSRTITIADVARVRENYTQMFGGRINLAQLGGNKRFLDGLIGRHVIAQEAERLGLGASDAELAEKIRKQFSDASGKFVGLERYKESVQARYGDVESYENEIRDQIAQDKLRAFVTASVNVSDAEIEEEYKRRNTNFDVSYIALSADKLAEKIQPSDEELRSYFESHKTDYRYLEPQKKIRYIFINNEKVGSTIQIPESDLKTQFDSLQTQFKEAGFKIQQILLRVVRKDLDAQVEQKAKDLIAKLRGPDGKAAEAAFAEAAKGNSEDPATARNGGFLAKPFKKNPNKVDGLYDRTVDMQVGDISDIPIRYGGNWYILRRGDSVPKTFAEAKPELLVSARNSRGYNAAFQVAQKAKKRLDETRDPQKVAQELAGEAHMTPAEMVRETAFIKKGDDVPNVGVNQQFEGAIEPLNNPNDVGEPIGVKDGFAIPMLVEKKDPRIPEFDEVKSKVADGIKQQRAKDQLEQKAKDIAAGLSGADAIKAAGEKEGFDAGTEESFKLGSSLGKAGISPALDDLIYGLKPGEFSKTPIKVDDKWVIVGVTKRYDADVANLASQRDTLKQSMISDRQDQVFEDYIAGVQQRMKRDGKIKIFQEVLDQLEEPAAEPVLPAGLNLPGQE
ncbi:MAG TPA: SurA N-terminal domain-containing protein [Pyrinomonadaceae bacterium]|jgi:peptidyl-prolyl cis-trans isomerase D|nr:SurA N-terminal domain-containing protein [Pyrinomonadaceae bacterium]